MSERLATDVFAFRNVQLRITRRDVSGGGDDDAEASGSGGEGGGDDDEEDESFVDPHFFDEDYSVAATTGFCRVWEGAEVLTRLIETSDARGTSDAAEGRGLDAGHASAGRFPFALANARVVELGAGVGLCGLAAASAGAHVMLTDLPAVVDEVLMRNIEANRARGARGVTPRARHAALATTTESEDASDASARRPTRAWLGGVPVVGDAFPVGTASAQPLDWTRDLDAQIEERRARFESASERLAAEEAEESRRRVAPEATAATSAAAAGDDASPDAARAPPDLERTAKGTEETLVEFWRRRAVPVDDPRVNCDLILAAECLWLRELVEPFCDTVARLLRPNGSAEACVLSFRDRSSRETIPDASAAAASRDAETRVSPRASERRDEGAFVPVADVIAAFERRGCRWETLAKIPSAEDEGYHVHVFQISF